MTQDWNFGSGELTPELVRGVQFTEVDGRVDAAELRTFLDRLASAVEVFLSGDAQEALRKEFARNAEIAQQVLDAGQSAAEQLRRQAAEDAKRILEETRGSADALRGDLESELEGSKRQVIEMRSRLMDDLRDLHDRIGASLYRFERAIEESPVDVAPAATAAADAEVVSEPAAAPAPPAAPTMPAPSLEPLAVDPIEVAADVDIPDIEVPAGAPEPAWTQLPADAWSSAPAGAQNPQPEMQPLPDAPEDEIEIPAADAAPALDAPVVPAPDLAPDPFAVTEDEPLAPGEPLVDLRNFTAAPVGDTSDDDRAAALLANIHEQAPSPGAAAPATAPEADVPAEPAVAEAAPAADDWLSVASDDPMGAVSVAPAAAAAPAPAPSPAQYPPALGQEPMSPPPAAVDASPDAMAVRQLILESFSAGQSREAIEAYLRDNMGFVEPGALIDAALASVEG